jgi:hypothetical protein
MLVGYPSHGGSNYATFSSLMVELRQQFAVQQLEGGADECQAEVFAGALAWRLGRLLIHPGWRSWPGFAVQIRLALFRWSHVSVNIGLALAVAQFGGLPNVV